MARTAVGEPVRVAAKQAGCSHVFWLGVENGNRRPPGPLTRVGGALGAYAYGAAANNEIGAFLARSAHESWWWSWGIAAIPMADTILSHWAATSGGAPALGSLRDAPPGGSVLAWPLHVAVDLLVEATDAVELAFEGRRMTVSLCDGSRLELNYTRYPGSLGPNHL